MRCYYTNANSLVNKMDELRHRVDGAGYHVVAVTETWANGGVCDAEMMIKGYTMYRRDRRGKEGCRGGGVVMYVKDTLRSELNVVLTDDAFQESVWSDVWIGDKKVLIGTCYRSTASDGENNSKLLQLFESALNQREPSNVLIMGDFNYPQIDYGGYAVSTGDDTDAARFFRKTQDLFLCQGIDCNTRFREGNEPSRLDLVFADEENLLDNINMEPPLGKSDHACIVFSICGLVRSKERNTRRLNYWKGDYQTMNEELNGIDWENRLAEMGVEEAWTDFRREMECLIAKCVPMKGKRKRKKNEWISKETKKKISKRDKAWKSFRSFGSSERHREYRRLRNAVTQLIRRDKKSHQRRLITTFKDNPRKFYGYVNGLRTVKIGVGRVKKGDGTLTEDDVDTAEELCRCFHGVFVREEGLGGAGGGGEPIGEEIVFTEEEVLKKLKKLKPEKSSGPDGMHPLILNKCADSIAHPLSMIFTKSYKEGRVPTDWKEANITPIFKKGNRNDPGNFRPVSLTSVVCKTMESIMKDSILRQVEEKEIMTPFQHGFRSGKSCLTNTLETLEAWTRLLDAGIGVDVVYLDYRKAFDTVPHGRLIRKLGSMGLGPETVEWIWDFLKNRKMRVQVNGSFSSWREVCSGVPQGSVLGPLLFLLFVNDLPDWIKTNIRLFADDAKIWKEISCLEDQQELQADLDRLREWSDEWLLEFNPAKCNVMHIGHSLETGYTIQQGDKVWKLDEISEVRDLGIVVCRDLKVAQQCAGAAGKAMSVLGLIKRHFGQLDPVSFKILYNSYVRAHLEYCIQSWSPYLRKDIDCLERVQQRATKLVEGMKKLSYPERLRRLKMTTLEQRRLRGDMIETYKIVTGREKVRITDFFSLSNTGYCLRGHKFKLSQNRSRLELRKNFFSQRVVRHWNGLPAHVVESPSVNAFKNRIDKEWGVKS